MMPVIVLLRRAIACRWRRWLPVLLPGLLLPQSVGGQELATPIRLGWNAAADPYVVGYAIYYGPPEAGTLNRLDVGTQLECTLSNLYVGTTYRIYAVSYNFLGLESIPSNELLYTPTVPALPPAGKNGRLLLVRSAEGHVQLRTSAAAGSLGAIQFAATPTAAYWQTLTNVTANHSGQIIAMDAAAARVPQRFYRFVSGPQPWLSRLTITPQANGTVRLEWLTPPGAVTRLQSAPSPNARIWTTRATITSDAEGRAVYVDTLTATPGARFYRAVLAVEGQEGRARF